MKKEVLEMIAKVAQRKGRLDLPIVSGKHLRKISDRNALQSADNAEKFITTRKIDSFESLAKFTADTEQKYGQLDSVHLSKGQKLSRLKELSKMYALYEPYRTTYKESQSLKGLAKMKFDREHKESLSKYPEMRERLQNLLEQGKKIAPKQWKAEMQSLQAEYDSISKEKSKTATELAYAEVISYNKKTLNGSFRTRAASVTGNKTGLSGGTFMTFLGLEWYWWLVIAAVLIIAIPFKIKFMKWWSKSQQDKKAASQFSAKKGQHGKWGDDE